jgi:sugar lactone lactonase YvrE
MARPFLVLDASFHQLVSPEARAERVAGGFIFTEGPVWCGDHLRFSDIPHSRIVRWEEHPEGPVVSTWRVERQGPGDEFPRGYCNGMTLDREDRLIVCGQAARRITRTEHDGSITVLADRYEGKRLNSPNDVVVHSSGAVYFTDPPHGLPNLTEGKELPFQGVFRWTQANELALVTDELKHPNGLAFSPDESRLYVGDDSTGLIHVFDVAADGGLSNRRIFAETPLPSPLAPDEGPPDGLKVDSAGNLYVGSIGGVWIFNSAGKPLGIIRLPEVAANLAWGNDDWRTLFITASTSLFRIRLLVPGIPVGSARKAP